MGWASTARQTASHTKEDPFRSLFVLDETLNLDRFRPHNRPSNPSQPYLRQEHGLFHLLHHLILAPLFSLSQIQAALLNRYVSRADQPQSFLFQLCSPASPVSEPCCARTMLYLHPSDLFVRLTLLSAFAPLRSHWFETSLTEHAPPLKGSALGLLPCQSCLAVDSAPRSIW